MPDFRMVAHGFVSSRVSDQQAASLFQNLRLLRIDSYNDFNIVIKGFVAIETLRDVNYLTGRDFAGWVMANYDGGHGGLAVLMKDISHYLNGKVGPQTLLSQIRIEENKLQSANKLRQANYASPHRAGSGMPFLEPGYVLQDYDLYRLAAGIGPAALGRLFLLLGGESYYG